MINDKILAGISIGDINGIGPEVIIKTLMDNRVHELCIPVIYGSSKVLSYHRKVLNIEQIKSSTINSISEATGKTNYVLNVWQEETPIQLGQPTKEAGKYALTAFDQAVNDLLEKKIDVLVTAPLNKSTIELNNEPFTGHSAYLAKRANAADYLMLLCAENFRIGLVTEHMPLRAVAGYLTTEKILKKIQLINKSLKEDFGIDKPKIAVLGLNPHAGDSKLLGNEDEDLIKPAIQQANAQNILALGPFAADGFFGAGNQRKFDGILAMYHDQGLIPFKMTAFHNGVNFTAGLDVVRTSPDHGVAYDIAGKNIASEDSFREALFMALDIFRTRNGFKDMTSNPIKRVKMERERR